jgi:hypothetical protein
VWFSPEPEAPYFAVNYDPEAANYDPELPAELLDKDGSVLATLTGQVDLVEFSPDRAYFVIRYFGITEGRSELWKNESTAKRLANWPGWRDQFFINGTDGSNESNKRLVVWYTDSQAYLLDLEWLSAMGEYSEAVPRNKLEEFLDLTCGRPFADNKVFNQNQLNDYLDNEDPVACE